MDMKLFKAGCLLFMPSFIVICLPTKHLGVLEDFFECVHVFQMESEFEKPSQSKGENQQQTQPKNGVDTRI